MRTAKSLPVLPVLCACALFALAGAGCGTDPAEATAMAAQAPLARLRVPRLGEPGAQLLFDASDAVSPGGALLHWRFSFGDGTALVDAGAPRLHHVYAAAGIYAVSVEVEDLVGRRARAEGQVTVRSGAPVCLTDADCAAGDRCQEARCTTEVGSRGR